MHHQPFTRRNLAFVALFGLFLTIPGACGSNEATADRLFLRVTSETLPEGAKVDGLRVLLSKGAVRFPVASDDAGFNFDLGALDPAVAPVLVAFNYSGTTFGDGSDVGVTVLGRSGGRLAARFETRVDLAKALVVDVTLKVLTSTCDVDGDGFPDCRVAGCCDGPSDFSDCEPTVAAANPWGKAPACRACGDTTDYDCSLNVVPCVDSDNDGDADCEEEACGSANDPLQGPGQPEICDGRDNDCDDIPDNHGAAASCPSGVCRNGACADPACDDTVKNGSETDVDCGGSCSAKCDVGEGCAVNADCGSSVCGSNKTCLAASCDDNVKNGNETAVDCGGPCEPCADGLACVVGGDCASGVCYELACRPAACGDGFVTGTEGCDDGAIVGGETTMPVGGDGCSATCTIENGWYCNVPVGATASVCATECGDAIIAGVENCDDGNDDSLDGCSSLCVQEAGWNCTTPIGGGASVCVVDEIPPEPPVITTLSADGVDVRGGLTNVATLTVGGTAEADSSVRVRHAGNVVATLTTDGDGVWAGSIGPLGDGVYLFTATATDLALNESTPSTGISVTVDTTPPMVGIDIPPLTNDTTPLITGTGENAAVVTMVFGGATFVTTIVSGVWTIDTGLATPISGTLVVNANGSNTITATARDAAGNVGTATPRELVIDTTPPTLTIGEIAGDNVVNIAETAAGIVISGTAGGAGNGRIVTVVLNGQTYTASVTDGVWSTSVSSSRLAALTDGQTYTVTADVTDLAGNAATQATASLRVDRTAPTIAISQIAGNDIINIGKANNGVTVSGTTVGAENGRIATVVLGPTSKTAAVSNNAWTTTFTEAEILAAGQGVVTVTANISDAAGNPATPATRQVTIDTTRPNVVSVAFSRNPINAMPGTTTTTVTFTFSEPVTNFSGADLTLRYTPTGGVTATESYTWSDLAVVPTNPNAWTATLTGKTNFTGTARITVGVDFNDVSGNAPAANFESGALTVDTVRPTVSVVFNKSLLIRNETATVTFTFNETPKAFNLSHLVVTQGVLSVPAVDPTNPLRFTATFTPTDGLETGAKGSVQVTTALLDQVDNSLAAAVTAEVNIDTLAPTVTIGVVAGDDFINAIEHEQQVTVSGTATGAEGRTVTVTLRGPGEAGALVTTRTAVVGSGLWSFNISGSIVIGLAEGSYVLTATVTDTAGNAATPATRSFTVDITPPTIAIATFATDNIVNAAEAGGAQVISGTTTGVANGRLVTISLNGTVIGTAEVSNNAWSRNVTSATLGALAEGAHTFSAAVSDLAGNPATPATRNFTVDRVSATVAITWEAVGGGALTALKAGETAVAVFTFSEVVTGFDTNDVVATWNPALGTPGTTVGTVTASGTAGRFTAIITPPADYEGSVVISVGTGWSDSAGNPAGAITPSPSLPVDTKRPTATVAFRVNGQTPSVLKVGDVATVLVTFSEAPVAFDVADLTPVHGTLGTLTVDPGNSLVYTATYTPIPGIEATGSVTLGTAWTDAAGNAPVASVLAQVPIDTAPPVLTINHLPRTITVEGETVSVVSISDIANPIVFTGTVTGLESGRNPVLRINNRDYTATRDGNNWTVTVSTSFTASWPQGVLLATVTVSDAAGNAAVPAVEEVHNMSVMPTVTPTFSTARINADVVTVMTLTFSTAPVGFSAARVSNRYLRDPGVGSLEVLVAAEDYMPDPEDPRIIRINMRPPADFTGNLRAIIGVGWGDVAGNVVDVPTFSAFIPTDTVRPTAVFTANPTTLTRAVTVSEVTVATSKVMEMPGEDDFVVRDAFGTLVEGAGVFTDIRPDPAGVEGQAWLATFTASNAFEGSVVLGTSSQWVDLGGNSATSVTSPTLSIDTVAPTIAIATIGTNDRLGISHGTAPVVVTATIGGSIGTPTFTLLPGVGSPPEPIPYIPELISSLGQQPQVWRITIPESEVEKLEVGTIYTVRVTASDAAGNGTTANRDFFVDLTRPTVAVVWDTTPTIAIGTRRTVTFDFSEAVTAFDLSDVTVIYTAGSDTVYAGNIFLSEFARDVADESIWRAVFAVPEAISGAPDYVVLNGAVVITVGTSWTDLAGNAPTAGATSGSAAIESIRPIATLAAKPEIVDAATPTSTIEVEMSEPVTGFDIQDLSVTAGAGTLGSLVSGVDGNPLKFQATFTRDATFSGIATVTLRAVDGTGAPAWTDAVGNGPRDAQTARLIVNVPPPPTPTVVAKTLCTTSDPQTITGTFTPQMDGAFTVRVRNNPFTDTYNQTYTLGQTTNGGTLTAGTPNGSGVATWTLTLTGAALRTTNGTSYQAIATVTNYAGLTASGEAEIRALSNPTQCTPGIVGIAWDGRPISHGAHLPAWRDTLRIERAGAGATLVQEGLNTDRFADRLVGGDALLALVAEGTDVEVDGDGDGLSDTLEAELGLDADSFDTNDDGIDDGDEDSDGDGFTNLEELDAGTDPADPDDSPDTTADTAATDTEPAADEAPEAGGCHGGGGAAAWMLLLVALVGSRRRARAAAMR